MENKKVKRGEKLTYSFDNFMSKGGLSIFIALVVLFVVAFLIMGLVRFIVNAIGGDESIGGLSEQLWRAFLQISDAGAVAEDGENSIANKTVGIVTIFLGLVLFSSLVAFITSQFEAKLTELRKGKSKVIEQDHTLILGFNDRIIEIIKELVIANESEKKPAVVVLSEQEKDEMDDFFRDRVEEPKNTRIITRSGVSSNLQMLRRVSITQARSVIVLNEAKADQSSEEKSLADARVLKTLMAVLAVHTEANTPPIVAELHQPTFQRLARSLSPAITVVEEHSILAKLMVQTSRVHGLALVYDQLVGFEGCEFYFHAPDKGWAGMRYSEAGFHYQTCSVLGIKTKQGAVIINPSPDTVLEDGDQVLVLAEDDSTIRFLDQKLNSSLPPASTTTALESKAEFQLLVGWNKKAPMIIQEYNDYLLEGSEIHVLFDDLDEEIRKEIATLKNDLPKLNLKLIKGDIHQDGVLARLNPEKYDNIIILKEEGGEAEERDAQTIAKLLQLRQYLAGLGQTVKTKLISEVADSQNVELIQNVGVKDFLISSRFVSKMYAQVSEDPAVMDVYNELFKAEGSEIYLKPLSLYTSATDKEYSFADLCAAALRRNETCFGVRIAVEEENEDAGFGIYLNPSKDKKFRLSAEDALITLAEDEA